MIEGAVWVDGSRCRNLDAETMKLFFPVHRAPVPQEVEEICWSCPAGDECIDKIMKLEGNKPASQRHGIYNAQTPAMRARVARQEGRNR